mmetsp:Transcript_50444/g.126397  ORF Transcript_50444/g.126397 Transcript_50444/m.126397 type:complete len:187 (+) Transcript_50444:852-1412(+)
MEDYIDGLLAKMHYLKKISQMVISTDPVGEGPSSIEKYNVNVLWPLKVEDAQIVQQTTKNHYQHSMRRKEGRRLGIPSITAVHAVHGLNAIPKATIFPHNIGLGCANDPDLMRRIGRVTALELRAVGFAWILAPVTAVPLSTGADIRSKAHAKSLHITDGSGVHRRSARGRGNRHWCGSYVQAFPG